MIYVQNKADAQYVFLPKELAGEGALSLSIHNTTTLKDYDLGNVADDGGSALYYRILLSLPEGLDNGEYEYALEQSGVKVGTGIIKIGEGGESTEEYNSDIEYEQYENE